MIRAVLFDLDGTLLDIDIDSFLREYFSALGPVLARLAGTVDPADGIRAVLASTETMCEPHPGRTNRDVFHERFRALTDVDLDEPEPAGAVERFYAEVFPALQRTHGPRPGGCAAVGAAREAGLVVALATNPIFPRAAIDERMRWAELRQEWFDVVTSYENMHACKPASDYFAQTASLLEVRPEECLMVGDDASLDLAADRIGMSTYYVGAQSGVAGTRRGSLDELARYIGELAS